MSTMPRSRPWLRWVGWTAAAVAALLLVGPFLLPLPELEDTVPPEELASADDRFAEVGGIRVRYRDSGSGDPTFLLLHGFGSHADSWGPVIADLAAAGRVVAFDRVGFGLTERPMEWSGAHPYGGPAQVDLTLGLMDELGVEEAVVVGHSAGGGVATALALDHPERVSGLVLEAPALGAAQGGVARFLLATPQGERIARFVGRRTAGRIDELLASAYHDPARITTAMVAAYERPLRAENWDRGLAFFTAAPPLDPVEERVSRLEMPVLVVTGDDDTWVATDETVALAGEIPGAELVVVPGCGHVVHEECPEAFLDAVGEWTRNPVPAPQAEVLITTSST